MSNLAEVVQLLKNEQDRLTRELRGITGALATTSADGANHQVKSITCP
jgi:hypothetical protein